MVKFIKYPPYFLTNQCCLSEFQISSKVSPAEGNT